MLASSLDNQEPFDVIVVGAGPAGCVLASRLSERKDKQVLLLEAGPDAAVPGKEHPDVLDPFCLMATNNSRFHWPGLTAEVGAAASVGGARASAYYVQGYGVGGASNINGTGADRGLPGDYDEWRDLGAVGWSWDEVLPYFKKLEHELDFTGPQGSADHGYEGPMPVRRLPRPRWAPFTARIALALEQRGFPFIDDYMTDFRDGFGPVPTNCLPDRRVSAATAYLTREVRQRPNLKIVPNTQVDRLSLQAGRVNGVFIRSGGDTRLLHSSQVVVTCGAVYSPALLMRSGIGPGEDLARLGIAVALNRPGVGANLQNHPHVGLTAYLPRAAAQPANNPHFLQHWLRFSSNHPGCASHDMHLMAFNKGAWHELGSRVGYLVVSVLKSYSKGQIRLASADADAAPIVSFNTLSDIRDEDRLVAGLRLLLDLLTDPQVAEVRHELFTPNPQLVASLSKRSIWNGLKARALAAALERAIVRRPLLAKSCIDPYELLASEAALRQFVRERASVQFHVCGTCRMGSANDPETVVDPTGRIYGIDGVRVADASIFPTLPRGYTHFIVLMCAEKIADAIKADWRRGPKELQTAQHCRTA